ncbi:MAG: hypothetical protein RMI91_05940 [Gemmatales bacterium]|nr:hypothetical protein [Gemmatales bacterium]MDW7994176.1 hypothetical protein [Gemmatales bacterium]
MAEQARVLSVEELERLRSALVQFKHEAGAALSSVALVAERAQVWLEQQERFWKQEIRKREEAVSEARLELQRRRMMEILGRPPDTTEQEKALRRAQARLQEAEQKLRAVKAWLVQWPRALNEYRPIGQRLADFVEIEMLQLLAWLQGRIEALQGYLATRPPEVASAGSATESEATAPPLPEASRS